MPVVRTPIIDEENPVDSLYWARGYKTDREIEECLPQKSDESIDILALYNNLNEEKRNILLQFLFCELVKNPEQYSEFINEIFGSGVNNEKQLKGCVLQLIDGLLENNPDLCFFSGAVKTEDLMGVYRK